MRRVKSTMFGIIAAAAIVAFGATPVNATPMPTGIRVAGADRIATADPSPTGESGSEAPATTTPPTEAPAPSTSPPATEAPSTGAPSPEPPSSTEPPSTDTPTTEPPSPQAPAADAPTAQATASRTIITPFPAGDHRLAGPDRFTTAVEVSKRFAPGVPVVYIATGTDFPDALAAAAAAAHLGGPLLLALPDSIPEVVRAELVRLAPARIVVAGGEAGIGPGVYSQLAGLAPSISRVGGADRYETGELIVADAFDSATEAFVATGWSFPDALAASAAAGSRGAPVVLLDGLSGSVRPTASSTMRDLGVETVRIAGGPAAIGTVIEDGLRGAGFSVLRYQGYDRYLTAAAVNDAVFRGTTVNDVFLTTGEGFADALAGAALAGAIGAPLYVVRADCIPVAADTGIERFDPAARIVLGGTDVVADAVLDGVRCPKDWVKPASGRITDVFGPRAPICTPGGCTQSFHRGVDLGTGCWAPIFAAAEGRVVTAGRVGTYGNFIKISHGDTTDTGYAHLADGGVMVSVGQFVAAGQQIGWSGATGAATGCHLHFEVYRSGTQIDPVPFMAAQGVVLG